MQTPPRGGLHLTAMETRRPTQWPLMVMALGLSGCALTHHRTAVTAFADPEASFQAYQTVAVATADTAPDGFRRLDFAEHDHAALAAIAARAMAERGFVPLDRGTADVRLVVALGPLSRQATPEPGQQTPALQHKVQSLETDLPTGTLVVDAFDRTDRHIWQGRGPIVSEPGEALPVAHELAAILAQFPEAGSQNVSEEPPTPPAAAATPAAPVASGANSTAETMPPESIANELRPAALQPATPPAAQDMVEVEPHDAIQNPYDQGQPEQDESAPSAGDEFDDSF